MQDDIDVATNWSQQTGKRKNGTCLFYCDKTIYAYNTDEGDDFNPPLGQFMIAPNGEEIILLNRCPTFERLEHLVNLIHRTLDFCDPRIVEVETMFDTFDPLDEWDSIERSVHRIAFDWHRATVHMRSHVRRLQVSVEKADRISRLFVLNKPRIKTPYLTQPFQKDTKG